MELTNLVISAVVTTNQDLVIDKAVKIIDIINFHLNEKPACRHSLNEILEDFEK